MRKILLPLLLFIFSCEKNDIESKKKKLDIWNTHSIRDWGSAFQYMELILEKAIKNGSTKRKHEVLDMRWQV